jgi:hypothetical protein
MLSDNTDALSEFDRYVGVERPCEVETEAD